MTEHEKLTGAELRQLQEHREREDSARQMEKQRTAAEESLRREQEEWAAVAKHVHDTWYGTVEKASTRAGVRFVVLARTIGDVSTFERVFRKDLVDQGFRIEAISRLFTQSREAIPPVGNTTEAEVFDERGEKGWCPQNVHSMGREGSAKWLVARW